ncbi:MAG: hypothetical protein H7175_14180 [Burkholderiales bacterium]|nr:hypothetical protein [Anaerolineae bacterium]
MLEASLIYLLLVFGLWVLVTAIYMPGTHVAEALAVGALALSIYLLSTMMANWWMVGLLVLSVTGFLLLPFFGQRWWRYAEGGLLLQAVGGLLLFEGTIVSPLAIAATIGLSLLYHRRILLPILAAQQGLSTLDDETLVGAQGRVASALVPNESGSAVGTVNVRGELWTARSHDALESGDEIIVVERDGLQLFVEPFKRKRGALQEVVSDHSVEERI